MLTQVNARNRGIADKRLILSGVKGELFIAQRSTFILQKSFPLGEDLGEAPHSSFIVHLSTKPSTQWNLSLPQ